MSTPASASAAGSGEIASLNGIRALAVSLVFLAHAGFEQLPGGLGVTLFFVLSGYLITTLLRREYRTQGAIALRAFYLRRLLRLMPPLLVVVALAALLSSLGLVAGAFSLTGLLSVLFYFGNYQIIASDFGGMPSGIGVVWSLAVEEHYYLLYPPLAVLLLRSRRRGLPVAVLAALCLAMLGWRCWLLLHDASPAWLMMATDTRADAILVGCLMAFGSDSLLGAAAQPGHGRRDRALFVGAALLLLATLVWRNEFFRLSLRYSLQSVALAALLWVAVARADSRWFRWLGARPLVWLGGVSYSVYLSHQLILGFVQRQWPEHNELATLLITAALTLALAEALRRLVEQPLAGWRRRLRQRPNPLSTPLPMVGLTR
ncbi:MAG: acyltransferase [Gammaproteobacteria bacterium]|nr:acyltransferase [Gammaproteobacteria bacterium]